MRSHQHLKHTVNDTNTTKKPVLNAILVSRFVTAHGDATKCCPCHTVFRKDTLTNVREMLRLTRKEAAHAIPVITNSLHLPCKRHLSDPCKCCHHHETVAQHVRNVTNPLPMPLYKARSHATSSHQNDAPVTYSAIPRYLPNALSAKGPTERN